MFSNHPGSDQLSQEGSQINIIADKTHAITIIIIIHNVLYKYQTTPSADYECGILYYYYITVLLLLL